MSAYAFMPGSPEAVLFHRLWSKAVGTPTYDKEQWKMLERVFGTPSEYCPFCRDVSGPEHEARCLVIRDLRARG